MSALPDWLERRAHRAGKEAMRRETFGHFRGIAVTLNWQGSRCLMGLRWPGQARP